MLAVSRLRFIFVLITVFAVLIFARLYFLQVVHHEEYIDRAGQQYAGGQTLYDRGAIFFENKDGGLLSAATIKTGFTIAISPKKIANPSEVYEKISKIIDVNSETFFLRAAKKNDTYEEIATQIPEDKALAIQGLKLTGVDVIKNRWRVYPGGALASNVLGMVGRDGKSLGYGLEKFYDDTLKRDGKDTYSNFFAEIFSTINKAAGQDGGLVGDIVTTIEPNVQQALEQQLKSVTDQYSPKIAGGVIINPQNGEIYAMGAYPTFDPNNFSQEKVGVFSNPIVNARYEMGSIIKPLTMAAGLDTGAVTAKTTYNDKGFVFLDGATIRNHDRVGHGVIPMQEVLNQSLNTGVSFVVTKMGKNVFADYFKKFGFSEVTGIDLPGEIHGDIKGLDSPRDVEYATASFGQGIALTPIETARALCSLGNGGTLPFPHIVKKINYEVGGSKIITASTTAPRVFKEATSEEITRMLVEVVDKALKGGKYRNPHYSVAAKTGTAQLSVNGKYSEDKFLHSFFGYFPAYNPKYLVLLYMVEPKNASFASDTLTIPFMNLRDFLINYYNVPPDR